MNMNKQTRRMPHVETLRHSLRSQGGALSLLSLKMVLSAAESESPARPPRQPRDPNEQLASQLIEKMKTEYNKPIPVPSWRIESLGQLFGEPLREMAGSDA